MSLKKLYEDHRSSQNRVKRDVETLRREALASVNALTEELTEPVHAGAQAAFENQKRVEQSARRLSETSAALRARAESWAKSMEAFDKELRAIGDFENWVRAMEHDLRTLASALEEKMAEREKAESGSAAS
ncbi:GCN5-like 1 [Ostreococcus tauri]|uniref:Biogenesis of lysosome-related organelles complex 1 subunit 1 n=1 Tax=Ostreococcus tauri TaxID=70448 RepID=A0A090M1Q7_OSTTA|nr:GCN5-like 1 [Ostreococcus tauri]OUS47793.1 general control of amino-acid synthesis 5-like 1 [Ostreococcus tauri]CEF98126.1 GCN5-like 1 [Ostreococcus tauri]|eukprot:XP_022839096.1 GCN5-like 1 [Ostreococcus tauri]